MTRLRRPPGAWRLVVDVGAEKRGHRRRTADRWPDTRRRASSVQLKHFSESSDCSDRNSNFVDVLLEIHSVVLARICTFG